MGRWALLNGLLGVIVLLLGLQIAWTWARSLPPINVEARSDSEPTPLPGDGPKGERRSRRGADKAPASPAVLVNTIHNKDLFDPSRQKASEEAKVAAPKETGPPPSLTLSGVRILGKDREAFITDTTAPAGQQLKRMRSGDQVSGYSVKSIEPTRVTLTSAAGDLIKLKLEVEKTGGGAAPGVPVAPGVAGRPPRPGQPGAPGQPAVPGAGAASPAAGIQPTPPAGAGQVRPPRAGMQARQGAAAGTPGAPNVPGAAGVPGQPNQQVPQLPAGVREKLEQLKSN
jgi:hypothetical protein